MLLKTSTKVILIGSALLGSQTAAIMLWERFPGASLTEKLAILFEAITGWLVTSLAVFLVAWLFFNLIFAFTRWIWARFYRTPTL